VQADSISLAVQTGSYSGGSCSEAREEVIEILLVTFSLKMSRVENMGALFLLQTSVLLISRASIGKEDLPTFFLHLLGNILTLARV
jgi:hypothetical protein